MASLLNMGMVSTALAEPASELLVEVSVPSLSPVVVPVRVAARSLPFDDLLSQFQMLELRSVLVKPLGRVAMINDSEVREGEMVGDARVLTIEEDAVTLLRQGETRVLTLYDNSMPANHGHMWMGQIGE